ncbi:MAG: molybdenum cofactor biosynthesis protein MoeB, partial [Acidobacteria bacterium]|nr:molybdenum cofactor biosynthesis protein MoeB [Acidobacteriota bacterium]
VPGGPGGPQTEELTAAGNITVQELAAWFERGEDFQLIDVREPHEAAICAIDGAELIPLGELPGRLSEVDGARTVVVHCKAGGRSAQAVKLLRKAGLARTYNLEGGILAWAREVEPSLAVY